MILVRVEEPAFSVRFSAFTTDPSIRLDGWESLRDTPFRVDYRIGSKIVDEKLTELVPTDRLSTVTHESIGIRKLLAGRTDVYVHQEEAITDLLLTEAFQIELRESFGGKIPLIAGVLEEQTIHAFLHSGIEP